MTPSRAPLARAAASALCGLLLMACSSHSAALRRAQRHYEDNQFERALALWRELDRQDVRLPPPERARFAYFRGMTDYRLGYRDDARHWLATAQALENESPGALAKTWRERLGAALVDLGRRPSSFRSGAGEHAVQTFEARREVGASRAPGGDAGAADAGVSAP